MLKIKSRKQQHLFDPWQFLSPKRREILDQNWPGFFRDHVLDLLPVETFCVLFPAHRGRPTKEMHTVLGTLALQQYHDLTDREACEQLAFNIQWHYALDIAEESDAAKYICPKTLWTMRTLATELGIDQDFFDTVALELAQMFNVDTSRQRIDSVHIRSNMARLGRIGVFVKGIDRFLVNLKRHHLSLYDGIDAELIQRYHGEKAKQCFAGVKPSDSKRVLSDVASDLYRLVTQFASNRQVADMSSYKLLCRIVKEQCEVGADGTIEVKAPKQIRSDSLQNPSDPDATYSGHKGQGYQVQVMETYSEHETDAKDPRQLNLITYVEVEKACQSDAQALLPALETTLETDLAPAQVQADTLYGSDENCCEAEQLGIELNYDEKGLRIARRRQHEKTEEFRQKYRWRAGVEATMSQYDRLTGVKRLRVRGMKAVRFSAVMKATAVNIARAVAARQARMRANGNGLGLNCSLRRVFELFKEQFVGLLLSIAGRMVGKSLLRTYAHNQA
jgi:IS5 family transposase